MKRLSTIIFLTILLTLPQWSFAQDPTATPTVMVTPTPTATAGPVVRIGAVRASHSGGLMLQSSSGLDALLVGSGDTRNVNVIGGLAIQGSIGMTDGTTLVSETIKAVDTSGITFLDSSGNQLLLLKKGTAYWGVENVNGEYTLRYGRSWPTFGFNIRTQQSVGYEFMGANTSYGGQLILAPSTGDLIWFISTNTGTDGQTATMAERFRILQSGTLRFGADTGTQLSFNSSSNLFQFGNSTTADNATVDCDDGTIKTNGKVNLSAGSELTVSSNAVTATKSRHSVTAASATALNTIDGYVSGDILILCGTSAGVAVTVTDGAGNIQCGTNVVLDSANDWIQLLYDGSNWQKISSSVDN